MATTKKSQKLLEQGPVRLSWRRLIILSSLTLNVAFIVVIITMATSNALDGMFVKQGMQRYCEGVNDRLFAKSTDEVKALRDYTCAHGDAERYFKDGFDSYLHAKGIQHQHSEGEKH